MLYISLLSAYPLKSAQIVELFAVKIRNRSVTQSALCVFASVLKHFVPPKTARVELASDRRVLMQSPPPKRGA